MSKTETKKPSLVNPDFSDLWSVARMGHDKKWYSKIVGIIVLSTLVYSWIGGFLIPFFVLFLFCIKYTTTAIIITTLIILPYFINISPQPWVCRIYIKWGAHYFDGGCTQILEKESKTRDLHQPILATVHPHGIFCFGYFLCCGLRWRALEDIHDKNIQIEFSDKISQSDNLKYRKPKPGLVVSYLCNAPIFNFFFTKLTGCVKPANNKYMKKFMKSRRSFGLLPGGFNEATAFEYGVDVVFIKERKGFIKYCLQYGYELWPCYIFGECESYKNLFSTSNNSLIGKIKTWLNKNKIPTVFPIGPYWFCPFLPYSNIGIHSIFSGNTRCDKIEEPTQQQIDEYHEWYMNEIIALFDRHKWRFGYSQNVKLKIL